MREGPRSSKGRTPIGQKKSVLRSVGSKTLRVAEEGVDERGDTEEIGEEGNMEAETRAEAGEVETAEEETEHDR